MRVLSVTHGPSVRGGVFDEEAARAGHQLDRWSVPLGGAPHEPESYDAVMIFGGSMHPDQDEHFPWLQREAEFLCGVLDAGIPALGVCLGAQLIARAAGAWVGPANDAEIGWHDVELTDAGREDPVLGTLPSRTQAFQWHHYTYAVPDYAAELAVSEACTQAFRTGSAWGIQFHAEVTSAMIDAWVSEDGDELPMSPAELRAETNEHIGEWNEHGRRLAAAFFTFAGAGR